MDTEGGEVRTWGRVRKRLVALEWKGKRREDNPTTASTLDDRNVKFSFDSTQIKIYQIEEKVRGYFKDNASCHGARQYRVIWWMSKRTVTGYCVHHTTQSFPTALAATAIAFMSRRGPGGTFFFASLRPLCPPFTKVDVLCISLDTASGLCGHPPHRSLSFEKEMNTTCGLGCGSTRH